MPLGFPNNLASRSLSRGYASASHAIALYCLVASALIVIALQAANPSLILWPCLSALVPIGVVWWFLDRRHTPFRAAVYLLIGGACLYWYAITGSFEYSVAEHTDAYMLELPKLALIFVGAGTGLARMVAWSAAGLVTAEVAVGLAARQTGASFALDFGAVGTFGVLTVLLLILTYTRVRRPNVQPQLTRAARDEHLSSVRYRIEAQAAAIMHDTVLNHLGAIAAATPGPIPADLRRQVTRDLEVLLGEEWLLDTERPDSGSPANWTESGLFAAIEEARRLGLDVHVSGDMAAVTRLEARHARAVELAAKQCLLNVIRHAGVSAAEVAVYGSESEVSVMIIDAGRGFSEAETGADRLGLRQSVRQRIESVGGSVQVWSTPGRGTSVMIRVPSSSSDTAATGQRS